MWPTCCDSSNSYYAGVFHLNCLHIILFTPIVCLFLAKNFTGTIPFCCLGVFHIGCQYYCGWSPKFLKDILLPNYLFACMTGHWREPQILLPSHSIYLQVHPILLLTRSPCLVHVDSCIIVCLLRHSKINRILSKFGCCKEHYVSARTYDNLPWIARSLTFEKEILMTAYSSFSSCFISGVLLMRSSCFCIRWIEFVLSFQQNKKIYKSASCLLLFLGDRPDTHRLSYYLLFSLYWEHLAGSFCQSPDFSRWAVLASLQVKIYVSAELYDLLLSLDAGDHLQVWKNSLSKSF